MKRLSRLLLIGCCLLAVSASSAWAQVFKAALGQSSVTMTGNWQFHTGDDLGWANPAFDDAKWEKISADKPWGVQGHPGYPGFAWYRRAVEIGGLSGPVSIYVPQVDDAYEVFWNGQRIGSFGRLPPHAEWTPYPVSNVFTLFDPRAGPGSGKDGRLNGVLEGVLAIRVWNEMPGSSDSFDSGGLNAPPQIGESQVLRDRLALTEDKQERRGLIRIIEGTILLLTGFVAIALWVFDRRNRLQLWLGIFLIGQVGYSNIFVLPAVNRILFTPPAYLYLAIISLAKDVGIWMVIQTLFGLDREQVWAKDDRDTGSTPAYPLRYRRGYRLALGIGLAASSAS